jgi:hypothetical protein
MLLHLYSLVLSIPICAALAPTGPWDAFNYAPASKIVKPVSVRSISGNVRGAQGLVQNSNAQATFAGNSSFVVLDWGKEVCMSPGLKMGAYLSPLGRRYSVNDHQRRNAVLRIFFLIHGICRIHQPEPV